MNDPIAELLQTPIPNKLWHYTSVGGFHGIVKSKKIFATDLRFLNDREEFVHARTLAEEITAEAPLKGAHLEPVREFMDNAVKMAFDSNFLSPNLIQIFVASFTTEPDSLSQWRGYSHGSSGVSLAFDLKQLRPPDGHGILVSFAPCVYSLAEKKALINNALSHFSDMLTDLWVDGAKQAYLKVQEKIAAKDFEGVKLIGQEVANDTTGDAIFHEKLTEAMHKTRLQLLRIAALLKNSSFHQECEWRLVLPVEISKGQLKNPILFRESATTLIPYVAYPLSQLPDNKYPLTDVMLGPGSHPDAASAAKRFLQLEGISASVTESKVPYRPI